jgi:hypothetical protein
MLGGDGIEVQFIGFPDILWRVTGGGLAAVDVGGAVLATRMQVQAPSR